MKVHIIRVDGTEEDKDHPEPGTVWQAIEEWIGAATLSGVGFPAHGYTMFVDDTGLIDEKPINPKATILYRAKYPGIDDSIHGDVAIVYEADFDGE